VEERRVEKARSVVKEAVKKLDDVISEVLKGQSYKNLTKGIWEIYSKVEYAIVLLKLHLRQERPGKLLNKKKDVEIKFSLAKASDNLTHALDKISSGEYSVALESARSARDVLRDVLTSIRKM